MPDPNEREIDAKVGPVSAQKGGKPPLVSVVIPTYNCGAWVRQAVESALAQRTSFPVEIVISDDGSTDDSVSIAREYEARYPGVVRSLARPVNVGMMRNYYEAFEAATGKYIAWLDGDDYWTDPEKLEMQTAALEGDATLGMCGHYVRWVRRGPELAVDRERYPQLPPGRHGLPEILARNFLPSPSILFRNGLQRQLPDWYFQLQPVSDWPINVLAAKHGGILMLDRVMADYTLNTTGTYWGKGTEFWYRNDIRFYDVIGSVLPKTALKQVRREKGLRFERLAHHLRATGDLRGARQAAWQAFRTPVWYERLFARSKLLAGAGLRALGRPNRPGRIAAQDR